MKIYYEPKESDWCEYFKRPVISNSEIAKIVKPLIKSVSEEGDRAITRLTKEFDNIELDSFILDSTEISRISSQISKNLKEAIDVSYSNIEKFHKAQKEKFSPLETSSGVFCWRENRPIENVGLYIPGGSAPLFSSLLMLGVPARIVACSNIVVCTPPNKNSTIHPALAYIAELLELKTIYLIGGAQAIAAMAIGTESVPKVSKIFGPGNQYVSAAKSIVSEEFGTAIDLPAGPTELLIIADDSANPDFIAADILSQAEHGADSQVIFLSTSKPLLDKVAVLIEEQLTSLPRKDIAKQALDSSFLIYLPVLEDAFNFSNKYAPEHLIVSVANAKKYTDKIINAGSVFLGNYTPESFGDYASGTNHTLPTNGAAHAYSGVSLDSFMKKITFQESTKEGFLGLSRVVEILASEESLSGHERAVSIRREFLEK